MSVLSRFALSKGLDPVPEISRFKRVFSYELRNFFLDNTVPLKKGKGVQRSRLRNFLRDYSRGSIHTVYDHGRCCVIHSDYNVENWDLGVFLKIVRPSYILI